MGQWDSAAISVRDLQVTYGYSIGESLSGLRVFNRLACHQQASNGTNRALSEAVWAAFWVAAPRPADQVQNSVRQRDQNRSRPAEDVRASLRPARGVIHRQTALLIGCK
jgi:hypothetical protein